MNEHRWASSSNHGSFSDWIDVLTVPGLDMSNYIQKFKEAEQMLMPLAEQGNEKLLMEWINGFGISETKYKESFAAAMISRYGPPQEALKGM